MNKRLEIFIKGDVQGVSYRYHAKDIAKKLDIKGWIKNEPDGSITIVIEGDEDNLNAFLAWCRQGSPLSEVKDVISRDGEYTGEFEKFEVR